MQTFLFLIGTFWQSSGLMLLGMALYKWGILSANKSTEFYIKMTIIGLSIGWFLTGFGVFKNFQAGWNFEYSMFIGSQFNYLGSVVTALGYVAIIMLICKSTRCIIFKNLMANVGKMAFTNYILMSVIAMFIFYGNGFGLFGRVERWEQFLIVIGIWIILIVFSSVWLKYFYYGPLEWLWRVLTYWKRQPFRKSSV